MSRVDALLAELAPDGVVYRRVADVAEVGTGSSDRKDANATGHFPLYVRSKDVLWSSSYEFDEDAIVIPGEGGIGEIFHYVSGKYALHQRAYRISFRASDIDSRYAFYYFSVQFKRFILQKAVSATVTSIRKPMISDFRIAVPPLEVQREIVRVLDQFTQLEAELEEQLEAELEARRRQLEHCLDSLFSSVDFKRVRLGELGIFTRGRRFTKADVVEKGIPSIHYGEIYTDYGVAASVAISHVRPELFSQLRFAQPGDVVIASVGETVEEVGKAVAWLGEEQVAIHDDTFKFRSELNPKFVSYCLQTSEFHAQKNKYVARAKIKRLSGSDLARIAIPVPSENVQTEIVEVLDKFDARAHDLSIGLLAELAARRKQYEYYRDKLLTFREAPA